MNIQDNEPMFELVSGPEPVNDYCARCGHYHDPDANCPERDVSCGDIRCCQP